MSCLLGRSFHVVLGLVATRQLRKTDFSASTRAWSNLSIDTLYCHHTHLVITHTWSSHTPGHHTQQTGQLHELHHHVYMSLPPVISPMLHQVSAGPLLTLSCWLSFANIDAKVSRGDSQVSSLPYIVLCIFHNVDECVLDSSNVPLWKTLSSCPPLLHVCWPWWYVISLSVASLTNYHLPA